MLTVTLLGGESSGKSTLARQLHAALQAQGIDSALVPEHLRAWCEAAGRAPQAHEQAAIAAEQTRLIESTRAEVVIADTTALMVAAYSELYFNDRSLWREALAAQRRLGLTLLMGLDLPWVSDGFFRDSPVVREATDAVLRRELQGEGIGFQTVYGQGTQRLRAALRAVGAALGRELLPDDPLLREGSGRWQCEACSDPDCEHRLFSALLARRSGGG
ncbi:MAG: AAA family ATPase [Hydrogenophaga sp.]|uniref:ATP-binding protein n=1 Tax=Hydrogenophaga sp. TaxID=1904254 RepID=UPI0016B56D45|nr:ATP-binding protein [Hydrogenophaga sp.]NIM43698.1 AAA family ATPase [Hydrogenophaga sp.]NIN28767.1 AAA family ATPase [Hydrogenophaga sp.]NIN33226.1 AAA family ATPase [Hydrogenophaga sp.]NIN57901.1 AAA family ATPase [Hydrogenophaga sp.]NIO54196.1 AAA family ATPase [Hydrogenophaga sp.]